MGGRLLFAKPCPCSDHRNRGRCFADHRNPQRRNKHADSSAGCPYPNAAAVQ